ncbi:unnamed protein product [Somion occarium]|uniref:DUF155 domain-containing protein n=1 Tax=Somion occarium TaxID=3059160 RepID=A0ABP1CIK2_9APHY
MQREDNSTSPSTLELRDLVYILPHQVCLIMSRPAPTPVPALRSRPRATPRAPPRRPSTSGLALAGAINPVSGAPKAQRTSKTTQKLVVLPTAPQTKPLPASDEEEILHHGYETDRGVRDIKSEGERMTKEQRQKAGFKRITAYCVAEAFKMKVIASFLKREHNVQPRMYDEAMYVMYHLPLLPGYGPNINIRSSAPPSTPIELVEPVELVIPVSEASASGYITSAQSSPQAQPDVLGTPEGETPIIHEAESQRGRSKLDPNQFAEVVFFSYGVAVFFGLEETQERAILDDIRGAGVMRRPLEEKDWEIEECHYAYDSNIAYPRVYNDFFTFKSHSPLLTLSVSHALAQSTLLARYETITHSTLSSPYTTSIPQQLASTGSLHISRTEALKITGRLFRLRRDVNLVSNVLDVPDLFWVEGQASLRALYDAVRDYMEIGPRVSVLNEKLAVAEDLLGAIHDHLNNNAMERITWIIIWLIVVACLVEVGEVIARLVFHAAKNSSGTGICPNATIETGSHLLALSKDEALRALDRMMK